MRTWQVEIVVVAAYLVAVTAWTGEGMVGWIGTAAVLLTFAHVQVADRLAEAEQRAVQKRVLCERWLARYLVGKELCGWYTSSCTALGLRSRALRCFCSILLGGGGTVADVTNIVEARQRKLEGESIGYFDESTPDIEQVQRTCDKKRRVAILNPPEGNLGWSMSPDETDRFADQLRAAAAEARADG